MGIISGVLVGGIRWEYFVGCRGGDWWGLLVGGIPVYLLGGNWWAIG